MLTSQGLDVIELGYIYSIRSIGTSSYIGNLVAAIVKALIRQCDSSRLPGFRLADGHTIIVDGRIPHLDRTIVTKVEVLVQLDQQLTVIATLARNYTDVAIRKVGFLLGIALDVDRLVQLDRSTIAEITGILLAVIHRSDFMGNDRLSLAIFVCNGRLVLDAG